jgi:hypothetical protein
MMLAVLRGGYLHRFDGVCILAILQRMRVSCACLLHDLYVHEEIYHEVFSHPLLATAYFQKLTVQFNIPVVR